MRWLGFDWDEGPEVGGPFGPYRQSERYDIYADVAKRLLEAGRAYHCYCSQAELDERNERARAEGRAPGYDGHCRSLTDEQRAAYEAEGRRPVVRFRMPDSPITFDDLVRGEITFQAGHVPDYVLVRGNGHPLYTLVNPVDDAMMEITHVLRGEDLLSSTPRQIALYDALAEIGVGTGRVPHFGHLPYVMGQGNKKLSKRDPESNLLGYRDRGFLPEGLLNYLALLGWAIAEDRDIFSMEEMVAAFTIERVNPNPARFDIKKAEAINATHLRALPVEDLAQRMVPFLQSAGILDEVTEEQRSLMLAAAPLVQERMVTLSESVEMLGFLFVDEDSFERDPADAAKLLETEEGRSIARAAHDALSSLPSWDTASIDEALRRALIEDLGLKPRNAFGPVRVAVTGRRISPPLFESLELLGRDRSLARLASATGS
jgi:glutamyl-tRNA synthetase